MLVGISLLTNFLIVEFEKNRIENVHDFCSLLLAKIIKIIIKKIRNNSKIQKKIASVKLTIAIELLKEP